MSALLLACFTATAAADQSILALDAYRLDPRAVPSGGALSSIFEMIAPSVVPLTEDAGGFGAVDPTRLSLNGASWTWTRWRIDGHDVTDALAPGSPAIHLPFAWTRALEIGMTSRPSQTRPSGVDLAPDLALQRVTAGVRAGVPSLGGVFPGAVELMNAISGRHVSERDIPPPDERRRFTSRLDAYVAGGLDAGGGHLSLAAEVTDVTRRFLDFDPVSGALDRTFDEPAARATAGAAWTSGDARVLVLYEHRARGALGAEAGLARAETMSSRTDVLFLGGHAGELRASLTLQRSNLTAHERSAPRELLDPDGEAPQPWQPDGSRWVIKLDGGWHSGPYYLALEGTVLSASPDTRTWSTPLSFAGAPYGRIDWTAAPTTLGLGEARLGHHDGVDLGGGVRLDWDLYAWAALAGRILQADLGADLSLRGTLGPLEPFVLVSKAPIAPTALTALALAPGYLEGRMTTDRLIDTWGGSRLDVDGALTPTQVYTGAIGLGWPFARSWRLEAQGLVEAFDHTPWIEGGNYLAEDGTYYLAPGEKRYLLTDVREDAPIYFGGQLQLLGADHQDYLFALSFSVFNVVGRTPPGNGPLANDPGILDRATANPTIAATALANTDADRAFLTKLVFGRRVIDTLWGFVTLRHRDGQPFAFPSPRVSRAGQVLVVSGTPRGSPFHYSRPLLGPREDFRLDVDLELAWSAQIERTTRLDLSLLVSNLLDMGNELGEVQVRPARTGRGALETQIPRALLLSLAVTLP